MADHHDALAAETAKTADNGAILGKAPVPGQRGEILDQLGNIIGKMRPCRMTRHLRFLPRRQIGIDILERLERFFLQLGDFLVKRDRWPVSSNIAQFRNLAFQFRHRFFKIKIGTHAQTFTLIASPRK